MKIRTEQNLPDVNGVIRRDPFSGALQLETKVIDGTTTTVVGSASGSIPNAGQMMIQAQNGPRPPVFGPNVMNVPNAGSIMPTQGSSGDVSVIATMIGGGKPLALIANGQTTDIVGVGDYLGRRRITRIVSQGIEFSDGGRLSVAARASSTLAQPTLMNQQTPGESGVMTTPMQNVGTSRQGGQQNPIQEITPTQNQPTSQPSADANGVNGVPSMNPVQYNFGGLPTPSPGSSPAVINRLFTPPPAPPKTGP